MAYFKDLTPYAYLMSKWTEQPNALNVGWLKDTPEPIGPVLNAFLARLDALVQRPVNLCRGWHNCWCGKATGNGEIRVTGADGIVYAAPVLISHYVREHGYQPPTDFVNAVMEMEIEI